MDMDVLALVVRRMPNLVSSLGLRGVDAFPGDRRLRDDAFRQFGARTSRAVQVGNRLSLLDAKTLRELFNADLLDVFGQVHAS